MIQDFFQIKFLGEIQVSYGPDHSPIGYKVYYRNQQTGKTRPLYYIRKEDK